MNYLKNILLLSVFFLGQRAAAQQDSIYTADARIQLHDLRPYTSVLIDSSNRLTLQDVSAKWNGRFRPLSTVSDSAQPYITYWLRVSVAAPQAIENWWLFLDNEAQYPRNAARNRYVDAYYVSAANQSVQHQRSGVFVPRLQKTVKEAPGLNRVLFSAKAGERKTIYLRIYNEFEPGVIAHPQLRNPVIGIASNSVGTMLYITHAVAFFLSLMSFFFFFFVREKAYLYFALYTLTLSQHYLILHPEIPFISMYIPERPHWLASFWNALTAGGFMLFLLFGRHFVNLPALSRKTDSFLLWFVRVGLSVVLIESVLMGLLHRYVVPPMGLALLFMLGAAFFIIRFLVFKNVLSRFFVAGALWLILFTVLGILYNTIWPHLPFNPWPIGQMGQLLIYAAGLAYKIRLNEKARAEADRIRDMDDIKSRFFANISHEFCTPLTLIQGPLQQIEEADGSRKEGTASVPWRYLKTMRRNTDRLLELVNQLLDLSRLDGGQMKLQVVKGDVVQLLKALAASFESVAERKGIHYNTHFPEEGCIAFFDKDKLEKIATNLLGNAFKYTDKGTVSFTAETDSARLRITIEDSGAGIAKRELDKVFDRFYRVESSDGKGSGIGLALVKELVELYRGQISVSSEPGKGSRFRVSLPMDKASFKEEELVYGQWQSEATFINPTIEKEEPIAPAKETQKSNLPLLLVVEDNTDLRQFICETVQQQFTVTEAANGKEGLEKAIREVPDIIISDVMMPVMDGFTLTQKLKKDERTSHIPIILLTAKAGQQHKVEGLETGADDYLTKPFDAKELLVRLHNLIQQRKSLRRKFAGDILLKPSEVTVNSADETFLQNVMMAIEKNMSEEEFGVEELAKTVAMSRSQLHRKLVALTGQSPSEVLRNTRLLRAKELLLKRAATPSEVAYQVGFNSHTYFSKCFKEEFGISPSDVR